MTPPGPAAGPSGALPVPGFFGTATGGVFRVPGTHGRPPHLLKILSPHADGTLGIAPGVSTAERACNYWARERRFYEWEETRSWAGLPLRPPEVLAVEDGPEGTVLLRLEAVRETGAQWSVDDYREVARQLGVFNGHCLLRPPAARPAWLSRSLLRWWFTATVPGIAEALRARPPSPGPRGAAAVLPLDHASATEVTGLLWRARPALFRRLSAAPVVLSHLDTNRLNLLRVSVGRTVAVDWSWAGWEALTADAGQLFASSAARLLLPGAGLEEYRAAVLDGYLAGLREAGCPPEVLRRVPEWYDLTICLRWGATHLFWVRHLTDPQRLAVLQERWWRRDARAAAPGLAALHRFFVRLVRAYAG